MCSAFNVHLHRHSLFMTTINGICEQDILLKPFNTSNGCHLFHATLMLRNCRTKNALEVQGRHIAISYQFIFECRSYPSDRCHCIAVYVDIKNRRLWPQKCCRRSNPFSLSLFVCHKRQKIISFSVYLRIGIMKIDDRRKYTIRQMNRNYYY